MSSVTTLGVTLDTGESDVIGVAERAQAPRRLGIAMIVAGTAYLIDTMAYTVLAGYADYAETFLVMVAVPSVIAEGWFGLWLLTLARRLRAI